VEVQVYREREFLCGRRWATRALALEKADEQKARGLVRHIRSGQTGDDARRHPFCVACWRRDGDRELVDALVATVLIEPWSTGCAEPVDAISPASAATAPIPRQILLICIT
jgi:hypothetical protein